MKKYNTIVVVVLLSNVLTALGQGPSTAQLQQWNEAHFPTHVEQFLHYLSLPNVSSDTKGIATNVNYIAQQLQAANLEVSKIDFRGCPTSMPKRPWWALHPPYCFMYSWMPNP